MTVVATKFYNDTLADYGGDLFSPNSPFWQPAVSDWNDRVFTLHHLEFLKRFSMLSAIFVPPTLVDAYPNVTCANIDVMFNGVRLTGEGMWTTSGTGTWYLMIDETGACSASKLGDPTKITIGVAVQSGGLFTFLGPAYVSMVLNGQLQVGMDATEDALFWMTSSAGLKRNHLDGLLYYTTDGGVTWTVLSSATAVHSNSLVVDFTGCTAGVTLYYDVQFLNDNMASPADLLNFHVEVLGSAGSVTFSVVDGFTAALPGTLSASPGSPYESGALSATQIQSITPVRIAVTPEGSTLPASVTLSWNYRWPAGPAPTPRVAIPVLSPTSPMTFVTSQVITLTCATPGAAIHYTIDGSTPTESSPTYSVPFSITSTTIVKAIGVLSGYTDSLMANGIYTLEPTPCATPTCDPMPGVFIESIVISLSCTTSASTIYYTTDGSTPTTLSAVYSDPITLTTTTTLQAIATAPGYGQSAVATWAYSFSLPTCAMPMLSPSPSDATFSTSLYLSMNCVTAGAIIYYTTDGSVPTSSSTEYTAAVTLLTTTTVKAFARVAGYVDSGVVTGVYTLRVPGAPRTPITQLNMALTIDEYGNTLQTGVVDAGDGVWPDVDSELVISDTFQRMHYVTTDEAGVYSGTITAHVRLGRPNGDSGTVTNVQIAFYRGRGGAPLHFIGYVPGPTALVTGTGYNWQEYIATILFNDIWIAGDRLLLTIVAIMEDSKMAYAVDSTVPYGLIFSDAPELSGVNAAYLQNMTPMQIASLGGGVDEYLVGALG